ncbi:MAG: hypothetical protein ABIG90_02240 [bacterium]
MFRLILATLTILVFAVSAEGATLSVPSEYSTIQAGIDAAVSGDAVLVANGTYAGNGNKNLDFKGKSITVKSESGTTNCIIDCQGEGRGFYFHSNEKKASVVDGLTIKNGYASDYGGGIYCLNSSPTIINNIITGSKSLGGGGGIYCYEASPEITNNIIISNSAMNGGGIGLNTSCAVISDNTIEDNSATYGAGIACHDSTCIVIKNNHIADNKSAEWGGGIVFANSSPKEFTNNIFANNAAGEFGGAIYCKNSNLTIQGGEITGNKADVSGGGLYVSAGSTVTGNCWVHDNTPDDIAGDGDFKDFALPVILSQFSAIIVSDGVRLFWETASENENLGFNVYWSRDKKDWQKIKWVDGAGRAAEYSFSDNDHSAGYYLLEQVDFSGEKKKLKIVRAGELLARTWGEIKRR